MKEQVLSTLGFKKGKLSTEAETASKSFEQSISSYLRQSVDWYDIKPLTQVRSYIYFLIVVTALLRLDNFSQH